MQIRHGVPFDVDEDSAASSHAQLYGAARRVLITPIRHRRGRHAFAPSHIYLISRSPFKIIALNLAASESAVRRRLVTTARSSVDRRTLYDEPDADSVSRLRQRPSSRPYWCLVHRKYTYSLSRYLLDQSRKVKAQAPNLKRKDRGRAFLNNR
ncbi:hypothetical protein EVAR_44098_1 [Eumeta japonica]|uniref:Uncharacterized protein n=1 Tax=Eumeta variegata TaxID=151549 RepID=A0A4C1X2F0_EUMVA|nr:hypothetical protein EVAR_44098_1 [Eumeta japonica]